MDINIRKRAFNLVAPLTFDEEITTKLLYVIKNIKGEENYEKLNHIINKAEYQKQILFGQDNCLPKEDFQKLAQKQLAEYILLDSQNNKQTAFLLELKKNIENSRLDGVSQSLKEYEYELFSELNTIELDQKNAMAYRRLLTVIILFGTGNFFFCEEEIENFISKIEKSKIKLK